MDRAGQKGQGPHPSATLNRAEALLGAAGWPEFTDDNIQRIRSWLPEEVSARRLRLLPQILREWAKVDLREHFMRESSAAQRQRRERLTRLGNIADRLLEALEGLDKRDRWTLAAQIGAAEGQDIQDITVAIFNEENEKRLNYTRNLIAKLAAGAKQPLLKRGRGQPRNVVAYLVMMDIAAIFEYLTGIKATREVDRYTGEEKGPFRDFAGAIWSLVFLSNDGLSAALKNWACGTKYGELSPLIVNVSLRRPEWGVFDPC
jgi:hypothetical protein